MERRLGEGVVVRSDDIVGNEVTGVAWAPGDDGDGRPYVALFTDDCDLVEVRLED